MKINEGIFDQHTFKAIFMAGVPGAGKSSIAKKIQSSTGLKLVDFDEISEFFLNHKKRTFTNDEIANKLTKKMSLFINGRLGMIIDKTSQDYQHICDLRSTLEVMGYQCAMVYVNTDLDIAKQRVLTRFNLTKRNVDPDYIDTVFKKLTSNIGKFQANFGNDFIVIDNTEKFNMSDIQKRINAFLSRDDINIAKKWKSNYSYKSNIREDDNSYKMDHQAPDKESGAPLYDLTANGIYPADVYSSNGCRYYSDGSNLDRGAYHLIMANKGAVNKRITIYRAVPKHIKGTINPGDLVSISQRYAQDHGKREFKHYKTLKKIVSTRDIFTSGDSFLEWGYDPQPIDYNKTYLRKAEVIQQKIEQLKKGDTIKFINLRPIDPFYNKTEDAIKKLTVDRNNYLQMADTHKINEVTVTEAYPSSFSMSEFQSIRSFIGKKKYADKLLTRLAAGSSRIVYQIDKTKVLKLAKNKKGLHQNNTETDYVIQHSPIVAKVINYDTENDFPFWVEMELAIPLTRSKKRFESLLGLKLENIEQYLWYVGSHTKQSKFNPPKNLVELQNNEWLSELIDLAMGFDMPIPGDFGRLSSYGEVKRNGKSVVVLIDYGLTNSIRKSYYS